MDDFSKPGVPNFFGLPPSPSNFIEPGKRPMSSMTPVIVVDDDGDVELVVGAAGGTTITTATSLMTMEDLWFESTLACGGNRSRIHQQLLPSQTFYEPGYQQGRLGVVDGLTEKGQDMQKIGGVYAIAQAIARLEDGQLEAYSDTRRDGIPDGY
ncbi:glutathione hydrolase light chain 1-like [Lytechinus variegatus]|uniref:glutathione hydrolase light chain 1-like n=1 Tax=Lytechinus variegatus TaxID=7654 RepID=UPI001BB1B3B6|nr:glutathione hydrolase light chain 1-like [Lytechinus variegatus]